MKKEKKAVLLGLLLSGFHSISYSQNSDTTQQLNAVIVTANRYETKVEETPKSLTVISSEDLAKTNYQNVGELLTNQEGIFVVGAYQNPGTNQSIFSRGTGSNQMVIMIDGVRITDPSSVNNAADLSELSLTNVDRIEIVRGAQSTLYGSSAIGGVINIITKKNNATGIKAHLDLNNGVFGKKTQFLSQNAGLTYSHKSGFYVNGSLYNVAVKGMDATLDTVTNPNVFKNRDQDDFSKLDYALKSGFRKDKWDIAFGYKNTHQKTDIDAGAYNDDDNYTLDFKRNMFSNSISFIPNEKFKLSLSGGYNSMIREAVNDSSLVDTAQYDNSYYTANYNGTVFNEDIIADYQAKYFHLLGGISYYQETMSAQSSYVNTAWNYESKSDNDSLDLSISTIGAYLQVELIGKSIHEKLKGWNLIVGGRYNSNSAFGNLSTFQITPSFSTSERGLVYATLSSGFNAPSLYQLYSPESNYQSDIKRGNINLVPEQAQNFEVGFKQGFGNKSYFAVAYFHNRIQNSIEYVYLWDKNISIDSLGNDWMRDDYRGDTYLNIGEMTLNGIEISLHANASKCLSIDANLTLVNSRLEFDPANIDTSQTNGHHVQIYSNGTFLNKASTIYGLARRPNTGRFSINYQPCNSFTISTTVRTVGTRGDLYYDGTLGPYGALNSRIVPDYTLWDMAMVYSFKKYCTLKFKAENILDKTYSEINGFRTRGRAFYLGLLLQI